MASVCLVRCVSYLQTYRQPLNVFTEHGGSRSAFLPAYERSVGPGPNDKDVHIHLTIP